MGNAYARVAVASKQNSEKMDTSVDTCNKLPKIRFALFTPPTSHTKAVGRIGSI